MSLTHNHVVADDEDHADLITEPIQIIEDDLESVNEVDENPLENDFAFNEQDKLNRDNNEHHVSKGVIPELKDIVSDDQLVKLDDTDPNHKEVSNISTHPSGRPVRKVTGKGRPMDDQYIYEI